jgi:hypothetical protein
MNYIAPQRLTHEQQLAVRLLPKLHRLWNLRENLTEPNLKYIHTILEEYRASGTVPANAPTWVEAMERFLTEKKKMHLPPVERMQAHSNTSMTVTHGDE